MKLSTPLALLALLPFIAQVSAGILPRQDGQGNRGGNNGDGGNANNGADANNEGDNTGANDGGNNDNAGAGANDGGNGGGDPQTSLTLDPRVIAEGFANDGQDVPAAGQVPSLTSTNNFINFCLTVPDLPITNGQQITSGSCNPAPIGVIPSTNRMPSSKFTNPKNGDTIPSDEAFTISMAVNNLATGNFVNAQENYFAAPQQLNGQGIIVGHSHVIVELLDALDQTTPTNPQTFAFFKGLNNAAQNGVLTADVGNGLPAGAYRLCSINAAANHQPVIVPVAQHGFLDDCVYFTATPGGAANDAAADNGDNTGADGGANEGNNNAGGGGAANDADNTGADGGANDGNTSAGGEGAANDADNAGANGDANGGNDNTGADEGANASNDNTGADEGANAGNDNTGADEGANGGDNTGAQGGANGGNNNGDNTGAQGGANGGSTGAAGGSGADADGGFNTGNNRGRSSRGRGGRNGGRGGRNGGRRGSFFSREH